MLTYNLCRTCGHLKGSHKNHGKNNYTYCKRVRCKCNKFEALK